MEPENSNYDMAAGSLGAQSTNSAEGGDPSGGQPTLFKVEGTLYVKDAELLEKICRDVFRKSGRPVVVELSDLCFLDSDSAAVLCRMKREQGVSLEGLNLFIKKVGEVADESANVKKYMPDGQS